MLELMLLGFAFFTIVFGLYFTNKVKEKQVCPCKVKVPFAFLTLIVMSVSHFVFKADFDYWIWMPFVAATMLGSAFVGTLGAKFNKLIPVGQGLYFLAPAYVATMMGLQYGVPDILILIVIPWAAVMYMIAIKQFLRLTFSEVWKEYLYTLSMLGMLLFSAQSGVGQVVPFAVLFYITSEIALQMTRFDEMQLIDNDGSFEYDAALIYIISLILLAIPKIIF